MVRRSLLEATVAALAVLVVWWVAITAVDGALAAELPYHQYETVGLLYPGVFYPGVPGILLADALYSVDADVVFGGLTYYVGLVAWMVALSAIIGAAAEWYADGRARSPAITAAVAVVALFVAVTAVEAVASLLA